MMWGGVSLSIDARVTSFIAVTKYGERSSLKGGEVYCLSEVVGEAEWLGSSHCGKDQKQRERDGNQKQI